MNVSTLVESAGLEAERDAVVFAALGEPVRLRILAVLADRGRCVCDIREEVPIAANLLSYHLRVLREAGLVDRTHRGRWIDYRLTDDAAARIVAALRAAGFDAAIDQPAGCTSTCGPSGGTERSIR